MGPKRKRSPDGVTGSRAFQKKLILGFAGTIAVILVVGILSIFSILAVINSKNQVAEHSARDLIAIEDLDDLAEIMVSSGRGFLITHRSEAYERATRAQEDFDAGLRVIRQELKDPRAELLVQDIERGVRDYERAFNRILILEPRLSLTERIRYFEVELAPRRIRMDLALRRYTEELRLQLERNSRQSDSYSSRLVLALGLGFALSMGFVVAIAWVLTRTLTALYAKEQAARRAREDLLAIVSHDLRTPVTAFALGCELLEKLLRDAHVHALAYERPLKQVQIMKRSVHRMSRLIGDLLDLARLEAGEFPIQARTFDLRPLLEALLVGHRPLADEKSVRIEWREDDAAHRSVQADPDRLEQLLANLLSNAIKFSRSGGKVTLQTKRIGLELEIAIQDEGEGIPLERQVAIFDRYRQSNLSDRKLGAGLGLFIVKAIVDAHHGRVWVESSPGMGSRFVCRFPQSEKQLERMDSVEARKTAN